jgi:hypothetical protein
VKACDAAGRGGGSATGSRGDLFGREFDVVVLAGGEIEADAALDLRVMVAAHLEAVAQGDALACARRRSQRQADENVVSAHYRDEDFPRISVSHSLILNFPSCTLAAENFAIAASSTTATPSWSFGGACFQPRIFAMVRNSWRRIAHHHALAGPLQHIHIVPVVADGHGLLAVDAEPGGEPLQRPALGDSRRQQVENRQVARRILGADALATLLHSLALSACSALRIIRHAFRSPCPEWGLRRRAARFPAA